ncbi:MAG: TetR/AcrR family transcriptional regulator [Deltaproteobacteria bacterium]|nr:TetR/AcrR family transcriptional regulator [Deltaproteobacteria bacterium]
MATKHDQNRAEKRDRLVRAAVDAFTETGYENTTVSDVVRRAGMTPSTFYNYYRDKDALRDELLDGAAVQLLAGLAVIRKHAGSVEEFVRLACKGLFAGMVQDRTNAALLKRNLPMLRSLVDSKSLQPVYAAIRSDISRAAERGLLQPIDAELATAVVRASVLEIGVALLLHPGSDVDTAIEFATRSLASALQAVAQPGD